MKNNTEKQFKFSPSTLSLFQECPRCFWLKFRKELDRPSGPFPSLPGGMDLLFKDYFDGFRKQGKLPPELEGKIDEKLFNDMEKLSIWRDNRREGIQAEFPEYNTLLKGLVDELLVNPKGELVVLDFKTRGFPIKEETAGFYQGQLDLYALLFKHNGYKVADYGYLLFFYPAKYKNSGTDFITELVRMDVEPERGLKILKEASEVIRGEKPKAHPDCAYCKYRSFNE